MRPSKNLFKKNAHALTVMTDEDFIKSIDKENNFAPLELIPSRSGRPNARLKNWNTINIHSENNPVEEAEKWLARNVRMPEAETIVLVGLGLGYELDQILKKRPEAKKVLVYERYPGILKVALSLRDYSREILKRRLEFFTWQTLPELRRRIRSLKNVKILSHPTLGTIYGEEKYGLENFDRISGRKVAVLLTGLLCRDIVFLLELMGFETYPVDITRVSPLTFRKFLSGFSPDLVFSVNYVKGVPSLTRSAGIPLVVWEIDPTIELIPCNRKPHSHALFYTYRKSRIPFLNKAGFPQVEYLPLASNHLRFRPLDLTDVQLTRYGADIAYVGASMVEDGKRLLSLCLKHLPKDLEEKILQAISEQNKSFSTFILPERLSSLIPGISMPWIFRDSAGRQVDAVTCIGEICASQRRVAVIQSFAELCPKYRIRVWGDAGWKHVVPPGVEYCGTAGHYQELPVIYNATKVNIDINRIYQTDIVPLRVFDVLSTGGFILADHSEEIIKLLDGKIVTYKSIKDMIKKAEYYLTREEERTALAREGRETVLKKHTLSHRLGRIISDLETLGWL